MHHEKIGGRFLQELRGECVNYSCTSPYVSAYTALRLALMTVLTTHQVSDFKAKMHQIRFRLGLRPRPAGGAYSAPPDPLAGFKGAYF